MRRRLVSPAAVAPCEHWPKTVGSNWAACQGAASRRPRVAARRPALEATQAAFEVGGEPALTATPIQRPPRLRSRASTSAAAPLLRSSSSSSAACPPCALPRAALAARLARPRAACQQPAVAQGPQELLLLGALLLQGLQNSAEVIAPTCLAAAVAARSPACTARPASASHGRRRGVVPAEKVGSGRHPKQGAGRSALAPPPPMPRRLPSALRRGEGREVAVQAADGCGTAKRGVPRRRGGARAAASGAPQPRTAREGSRGESEVGGSH